VETRWCLRSMLYNSGSLITLRDPGNELVHIFKGLYKNQRLEILWKWTVFTVVTFLQFLAAGSKYLQLLAFIFILYKAELRRDLTYNSERNSKFCFSQNSNLKVLKFHFEKYCYCSFKAGFPKTSYFRPLEKISWDGFIQLSLNLQDLFFWIRSVG